MAMIRFQLYTFINYTYCQFDILFNLKNLQRPFEGI